MFESFRCQCGAGGRGWGWGLGGAYKRNQETLAQLSFLIFSLWYFEIAGSVCQYIHGISAKKERKERSYILRIMTSLCFVIPDPDPPYLCVPYHF